MALYGSPTEYALHTLLLLSEDSSSSYRSATNLAEFQGISVSYLAKLLPKLERADIVTSVEGIGGGYKLARSPAEIYIGEVVKAVEGKKKLFDCKNIRGRCALFNGRPPPTATSGRCAIHAAMLEAEAAMQSVLAKTSLKSIATKSSGSLPPKFLEQAESWFFERKTVDRSASSKIKGPTQ